MLFLKTENPRVGGSIPPLGTTFFLRFVIIRHHLSARLSLHAAARRFFCVHRACAIVCYRFCGLLGFGLVWGCWRMPQLILFLMIVVFGAMPVPVAAADDAAPPFALPDADRSRPIPNGLGMAFF